MKKRIPAILCLAFALVSCAVSAKSEENSFETEESKVFAEFVLREVRPTEFNVYDDFRLRLYEDKSVAFTWVESGTKSTLETTYDFATDESGYFSKDVLRFKVLEGKSQAGCFSLYDRWGYKAGDNEIHYQSNGVFASGSSGDPEGYLLATFALV